MSNDVWGNVKAVFDMAEKKTTQAYELSKKKIQEKKLEDKLDSLYASLGKVYYMSCKGSAINDEDVQKTIARIEETKAQLKAVREEIKELRFKNTCPDCGASVRKDDGFCSKCGKEIK